MNDGFLGVPPATLAAIPSFIALIDSEQRLIWSNRPPTGAPNLSHAWKIAIDGLTSGRIEEHPGIRLVPSPEGTWIIIAPEDIPGLPAEEEARLIHSMVMSIPENLLLLDEEGTILFVNRLSPLTGGRSEAVGQSVFDFAHPSDVENVRRNLKLVLETGTPQTYEAKDAHTERVFSVRLIRADTSQGIRTLMSTWDITDLRKSELRERNLESQLLQAQKMESLGKLAGGVAHDFNNLLTGMLGQLSFAQLAAEGSDELLGILGELESSIDRAAALTRQLLTFGRRQPHSPTRIDASVVAAEVVNLLRRTLPARIEVRFDPAPNPVWVDADPAGLHQIIMNLCLNARDAITGPGRIDVAVGRSDTEAVLQIRDTGSGMDAAVLARIYEPFFTTKDIGQGTGLGLSIVHGLVARHEGELLVTSEVGTGTTFSVRLPIRGRPQRRRRTTTSNRRHRPRTNATILLADDAKSVRDALAIALRSVGFEVLVAADGREALDIVADHRDEIDIAVLDAMMPKLSGRHVYEALQRAKPEVPVIFCTGYTADIFPPGYLEERELRVLAKPFAPSALLRAVQELLGGDANPR